MNMNENETSTQRRRRQRDADGGAPSLESLVSSSSSFALLAHIYINSCVHRVLTECKYDGAAGGWRRRLLLFDVVDIIIRVVVVLCRFVYTIATTALTQRHTYDVRTHTHETCMCLQNCAAAVKRTVSRRILTIESNGYLMCVAGNFMETICACQQSSSALTQHSTRSLAASVAAVATAVHHSDPLGRPHTHAHTHNAPTPRHDGLVVWAVVERGPPRRLHTQTPLPPSSTEKSFAHYFIVRNDTF